MFFCIQISKVTLYLGGYDIYKLNRNIFKNTILYYIVSKTKAKRLLYLNGIHRQYHYENLNFNNDFGTNKIDDLLTVWK